MSFSRGDCPCRPGAVCLLLVSSAVTMAVPFAIGRVVDIIYREEAGQARDRLVTICLGLGAVFLVGAAANCGRVYLMTISGQWDPGHREL